MIFENVVSFFKKIGRNYVECMETYGEAFLMSHPC